MYPESLNEVVNAPPRDTLDRLKNTAGGTDLDESIDWSVIGQLSGSQAYICYVDANKQGVRDWSELGVEIYRRLKNQGRSYENELAEMRLRANAIVFSGIDPSNALLNPNVIESWFFQMIPYSIEEVRKRTSQIQDVQSADFAALRSLKERLSVIKCLVERTVFQKNAQLQEWVSLLEELP